MKSSNNPTTATCDKIGEINISGNVIPPNWYHKISFENGKCDLVAVNILAEIIYWYRPTVIRNEQTGKPLGKKRKFKADMLQKSYQDFADQFGLTKNQVRRACKNLQRLNLIRIDFREVKIKGLRMNNVMFVEPDSEVIKRITEIDPVQLQLDSPLIKNVQRSNSNCTAPQLELETNTKITTKITTESTHLRPPTSGNSKNKKNSNGKVGGNGRYEDNSGRVESSIKQQNGGTGGQSPPDNATRAIPKNFDRVFVEMNNAYFWATSLDGERLHPYSLDLVYARFKSELRQWSKQVSIEKLKNAWQWYLKNRAYNFNQNHSPRVFLNNLPKILQMAGKFPDNPEMLFRDNKRKKEAQYA